MAPTYSLHSGASMSSGRGPRAPPSPAGVSGGVSARWRQLGSSTHASHSATSAQVLALCVPPRNCYAPPRIMPLSPIRCRTFSGRPSTILPFMPWGRRVGGGCTRGRVWGGASTCGARCSGARKRRAPRAPCWRPPRPACAQTQSHGSCLRVEWRGGGWARATGPPVARAVRGHAARAVPRARTIAVLDDLRQGHRPKGLEHLAQQLVRHVGRDVANVQAALVGHVVARAAASCSTRPG